MPHKIQLVVQENLHKSSCWNILVRVALLLFWLHTALLHSICSHYMVGIVSWVVTLMDMISHDAAFNLADSSLLQLIGQNMCSVVLLWTHEFGWDSRTESDACFFSSSAELLSLLTSMSYACQQSSKSISKPLIPYFIQPAWAFHIQALNLPTPSKRIVDIAPLMQLIFV